jgi:hypothetical protein
VKTKEKTFYQLLKLALQSKKHTHPPPSPEGDIQQQALQKAKKLRCMPSTRLCLDRVTQPLLAIQPTICDLAVAMLLLTQELRSKRAESCL